MEVEEEGEVGLRERQVEGEREGKREVVGLVGGEEGQGERQKREEEEGEAHRGEYSGNSETGLTQPPQPPFELHDSRRHTQTGFQ